MKDKQDRDDGLRDDLDALLSEAMKQAGVQQTMAMHQTYQEMVDSANPSMTAGIDPLVRVINGTRSGG